MKKLNIIPLGWLEQLAQRISDWAYNTKRYDSQYYNRRNNDSSPEFCPICGEKLVGGNDYDYELHITLEYCWSCPNKHYSDEYAYGGYLTYVGDKEFHAHYSYDDKQWQIFNKEITKEVQLMKNRWYHTWFIVKFNSRKIWYALEYRLRELNRTKKKIRLF